MLPVALNDADGCPRMSNVVIALATGFGTLADYAAILKEEPEHVKR